MIGHLHDNIQHSGSRGRQEQEFTADTRPPFTSSTRMNQSEVRGGDQGPMKGKGRQGGRGREQATQQQALGGDGRCGKFEVRHADTSDRRAQEDEAREPAGTHGHS